MEISTVYTPGPPRPHMPPWFWRAGCQSFPSTPLMGLEETLEIPGTIPPPPTPWSNTSSGGIWKVCAGGFFGVDLLEGSMVLSGPGPWTLCVLQGPAQSHMPQCCMGMQ